MVALSPVYAAALPGSRRQENRRGGIRAEPDTSESEKDVISDDDLRKLIDLLDSQKAFFIRCIGLKFGGEYVEEPDKALFLEIDERLEVGAGAIREAILRFPETQCWPELSARQAWLLFLRVYNARELLPAVVRGRFPERLRMPDSRQLFERIRGSVPKLTKPCEFIPWLLIDLWELGGIGAAFLKAYSGELQGLCAEIQKLCSEALRILPPGFVKLGLRGLDQKLPFWPADDAARPGRQSDADQQRN